MNHPRLIAIGGGGFAAGTDPALDDFVLKQIEHTLGRVGYVGTASDDDPVRIGRFFERIAPRARVASVLPSGSDASAAAEWASKLDAIYVGGGSPKRLLDTWRASGIGSVFCAAARAGTLLAGVSAGAICWFEQALVRGEGQDLVRIAGLGLIAGSCCVHYSTESDRRTAFPAHIAQAELPAGLAIDDGVAVLLAPDLAPRAFSARDGSWAYAVRRMAGGGVESAPVAPFVNG